MEPKDTAFEIAHVLDEKKACDIVIADVSEVADICDFFVIATAPNKRLVDSLVDDVDEHMAALGVSHGDIEGREECTWALMDYGPVVVHIFQPEAREYYRLERLWNRARFYDVDEEGQIVGRPSAEAPAKELVAE